MPRVTVSQSNAILIDDIKNTKTKFFFNWEIHKLEDKRMFLIKNGEGVVHELTEINLIEVALAIDRKIVGYDWEFCKNLFHVVTNWSLE